MLNVTKVRTSKKMSKYELCKRTGIDFHTLSKIEEGSNTRLFTFYFALPPEEQQEELF